MTLEPPAIARVQLCGALVVERGGERIDSLLPGRQGRLLFAYLTVNRHRSVPRAELVEALWPGESPPAAAGALNALVSKLRRVLGPEVVEGRSSLRLALGSALVDLEAATAAIHRAESAVALGRFAAAWAPSLVALFVAERELLPGEDAPWIDEQRRRLDELHLRALECYATAALGIGGTELAAADRAARQLVDRAPLRESGYRCLMEALAAQGNVAEALRVYSNLCGVLAEELGVSPSPLTRGVYERLVLA